MGTPPSLRPPNPSNALTVDRLRAALDEAIAMRWPEGRAGSGSTISLPFDGFYQDILLSQAIDARELRRLETSIREHPKIAAAPHWFALMNSIHGRCDAQPPEPGMQRVYGIAPASEDDLRRLLALHDAAWERDALRVARRLQLAQGTMRPHWLSGGRRTLEQLEREVYALYDGTGYEPQRRTSLDRPRGDTAYCVAASAEIAGRLRSIVELTARIASRFGLRLSATVSTPAETPWPLVASLVRDTLTEVIDPAALVADTPRENDAQIQFFLDNLYEVPQHRAGFVRISRPPREDGSNDPLWHVEASLTSSFEELLLRILERAPDGLPLALAPLQVRIVPWSRRFLPFSESVRNRLTAAGVRSDVEKREESVKFKTREAFIRGAYYVALIGPEEERAGCVSLVQRARPDEAQRMTVRDAERRIALEANGLFSTESTSPD